MRLRSGRRRPGGRSSSASPLAPRNAARPYAHRCGALVIRVVRNASIVQPAAKASSAAAVVTCSAAPGTTPSTATAAPSGAGQDGRDDDAGERPAPCRVGLCAWCGRARRPEVGGRHGEGSLCWVTVTGRVRPAAHAGDLAGIQGGGGGSGGGHGRPIHARRGPAARSGAPVSGACASRRRRPRCAPRASARTR